MHFMSDVKKMNFFKSNRLPVVDVTPLLLTLNGTAAAERHLIIRGDVILGRDSTGNSNDNRKILITGNSLGIFTDSLYTDCACPLVPLENNKSRRSWTSILEII